MTSLKNDDPQIDEIILAKSIREEQFTNVDQRLDPGEEKSF